VQQQHRWTQQESRRAAEVFATRSPWRGGQAAAFRQIAVALNLAFGVVQTKYKREGPDFMRKPRPSLDLPRVKRFRSLTQRAIMDAVQRTPQ
jgi:hypothetical protein